MPEPQVKPDGKVIARVGDIQLTDRDLARYKKFREISEGVLSDSQALGALCERALLNLAAADHQLAISPGTVDQLVLRQKIVAGASSYGLRAKGLAAVQPAVGSSSPGASGGNTEARGNGTGAPVSAQEAGEQLFASTGLSRGELETEVKSDATAQLARQVLVYNKILISKRQMKVAYEAARRSPEQYSLNTRIRRRADKATVERLRRQLILEKGAEPLRALIAESKQKWKFDCGTN
jgi:hypothetical protein